MVAESSEGLLDPSLTGNTIKLILLSFVMVWQYFDALFWGLNEFASTNLHHQENVQVVSGKDIHLIIH